MMPRFQVGALTDRCICGATPRAWGFKPKSAAQRWSAGPADSWEHITLWAV